ncbi:transcription initiation protein [Actinomadura sp. NPDC047616]|uniref:YciI family protein n=1 Tax=Actinomadura sp. NPDC047616 TaxID=3155914 RepID=UPI0033C7B424
MTARSLLRVKYMLLICGDESAAAHAEEGCGGWSEEMRRRGVVRGGAGLRPPAEATTVRVRDERVLLTDEPLTGAAQDLLLVICGRRLPAGDLRGRDAARFTA